MFAFTSEYKDTFLNELLLLNRQLSELTTTNTSEALERFENLRTINELKTCFICYDHQNLTEKLIELLANRWTRIQKSSLCYTQNPTNGVNQFCLKLAKVISPPANTKEEIEALQPNEGPYTRLMPTLAQTIDVYGENIHELGLGEFILSDDGRVVIPLLKFLEQALNSNEGRFFHVLSANEDYPEASQDELHRISTHSELTKSLYESVVELNIIKLFGEDMGSQLNQLMRALRSGGRHQAGDEFNAASVANEGIVAFHEYWKSINETQKEAIFKEEPQLRDILGRLFRPKDEDYTDQQYCVELIAGHLEPIVNRINQHSKQRVMARFNQQKMAFLKAVEQHRLPIKRAEHTLTHLLPDLFKHLSPMAQAEIFKHESRQDGIEYILKHALEYLPDIDFNQTTKDKIISFKTRVNEDSALLLAAKEGHVEVVRLLRSWGADIHSKDNHDRTALHWAAINGHLDMIKYLLNEGAGLEARNTSGNTPLNEAIYHKRNSVVPYLLANNAHLNVRNEYGQNALDIAIYFKRSDIIQSLLLKIRTLPLDEQSNILPKLYPNAWFYVGDTYPELLQEWIDNLLQQPLNVIANVLNAKDNEGWNLLIYAANAGDVESIEKILAHNAQCLHAVDHKGSNALHWAALNGHLNAMECLLNHGASIDAQGCNGNTALQFALINKKEEAFDYLLDRHANVYKTNHAGENALIIVGRKNASYECIKKLLDHNVDIDATDNDGRTALYKAALEGHREAVFHLLSLRANVNVIRRVYGYTALMIALFKSHWEIASLLLSHGANPSIKNTYNHNIFSFLYDVHDTRGPNIPTPLLADLIFKTLALPSEQLEACFKEVPQLPIERQRNEMRYKTPLDYVAFKEPHRFKEIIERFARDMLPEDDALKNGPIFAHLSEMVRHYNKLKWKSYYYPEYRSAMAAAKPLIINCLNALVQYYKSDADKHEKLQTFKAICQEAIQTARPVLKKYRNWSKVIEAFILALLTLPISLPLYLCGFFSIKTRSEQLLDKIQTDLNQSIETQNTSAPSK